MAYGFAESLFICCHRNFAFALMYYFALLRGDAEAL